MLASSFKLLFLIPVVVKGRHLQTACSSQEILLDDCIFTLDGVCDADGSVCSIGTDCVDCDPCAAYDFSSCEECTSNDCLWCESFQFCVSESTASVLSDSCTDSNGGLVGSWATACTVSITTAPFQSPSDSAFTDAPVQSPSDLAFTDAPIQAPSDSVQSPSDSAFTDTPVQSPSDSAFTDAPVQSPSSEVQFCSVDQVLQDDCSFSIDFVCDADGVICPMGTDCFDCDPCAAFDITSCEECSSNGCVWCSNINAPFCFSPTYVEAFPSICSDLEGPGDFTNTCDSLPTSPPITVNASDICTPDQVKRDQCVFADDGVCDADGALCPIGSDCYDCDPCIAFDLTSCEECTSNGCAWCTNPNTPFCYNPSIAQVNPFLCSASEGGSGDFLFDRCNATSTPPTQPGVTPTSAPTSAPGMGGTRGCSINQFARDPCQWTQDDICDAPAYCLAGTDCFDCDPCKQFSFTGCNECVSNEGCFWCGMDSICASAKLDSQIIPNIGCTVADYVDTTDSCAAETTANVFADPLYSGLAWIYEQINVEEVWKSGITGSGITIRVNDDGLDVNHPDISSTFDLASSCEFYLPVIMSDTHGTTCASLAAGSANNVCSVGIAPDAAVSACKVLGRGDVVEEGDQYLPPSGGTMDVSSNSYGVESCKRVLLDRQRRRLQTACPFATDGSSSPCLPSSPCASADWGASSPQYSEDCEREIYNYCSSNYENDVEACAEYLDLFISECRYNTLSRAAQDALIQGVTSGRNGKGIIYVFASGNAFGEGDDTNFKGTTNSRFIISVGSVNKVGEHAYYSTPGAALFLSAPGGDAKDHFRNAVVALASIAGGGSCWDAGQGTSYSCPVVAGVSALVLEANPDLSWRDVQGIFAITAQKTDANDTSWFTNAAGLHHSYKYGFGLVDALAAVERAKAWENYTPEQQIIIESGQVDLLIPEFPAASVSSTVNVVTEGFMIESVVVYLDLSHGSRGDLDIVLTCPSGTQSILIPGGRPENTQLNELWKLMTVRCRDEDAAGDWQLSFVDRREGDIELCADLPYQSEYLEDCSLVDFLDICVDGAAGPEFADNYGDITPSDPSFLDSNGNTLASACCACGGGQPVDEADDVLKSWRLAIYGRKPGFTPHAGPPASSNNGPTPIVSKPTQQPESMQTPTNPPSDAIALSYSTMLTALLFSSAYAYW